MAVKMRYGAENGAQTSGVIAKRLWTNLNPTSNFAAQTIQGNFGGYDFLIVEFNLTSSGNRGISICKYDSPYMISAYGTSTYYYSRRLTFTASDVTFTTGYRNGTGGAGYAIPVSITGIKL